MSSTQTVATTASVMSTAKPLVPEIALIMVTSLTATLFLGLAEYPRPMLLWTVERELCVWGCCEPFSRHVALVAAYRFYLGQSVFHPALDVVLGSRVLDHAGEHDVPESGVGLTVATAVEPMTLLVFTRAGSDPGGASVRPMKS